MLLQRGAEPGVLYPQILLRFGLAAGHQIASEQLAAVLLEGFAEFGDLQHAFWAVQAIAHRVVAAFGQLLLDVLMQLVAGAGLHEGWRRGVDQSTGRRHRRRWIVRKQGRGTIMSNWIRSGARNAACRAVMALATASQPRSPDDWRHRYVFSSSGWLPVCSTELGGPELRCRSSEGRWLNNINSGKGASCDRD